MATITHLYRDFSCYLGTIKYLDKIKDNNHYVFEQEKLKGNLLRFFSMESVEPEQYRNTMDKVVHQLPYLLDSSL